MEERISESVAPRRFYTIVVGAFAGATLVLVALALYGVLASSVASRTREIGIRSAIGASSTALTRDVVIQGLRPTLLGLIAGVAGGAGAASAIRVLLVDVTPGDASTYVAAAAALLVVAIASSWIPARRAARIDPSAALRSE
jgi:putative ABC transport system permease protein